MNLIWHAVVRTFVGGIALLALLAALPAAWAQDAPAVGKTLIDTDFGASGLAMNPAAGERITGALPAPWLDESSWAKVGVRYETAAEAGQTFMRMTVTRPETGWAQFKHPLPDLTGGRVYLLEMTVRGTPEMPVSFGIRQSGEPYRFLWQGSLVLAADWRSHTLVFEAPKNEQPIGFYFLNRSAGVVEIDRMRLREVTREEAGQALRALHAGESLRNLLGATRFPLGLPAGWSPVIPQRPAATGRDAEVTFRADPGVAGPSGAPALKIAAPQPFQLSSAPFAVPIVTSRHVASFYVRGQGKGRFAVVSGGKWLASRDFETGDGAKWQRIELPFTPGIFAPACVLRFEGDPGTYWLDAVQVEEGETARPYTPQRDAEVALACDVPANIQFVDDPAVVRWSVTGAPDGARMRFRVVNVYGDESTPPAVTLGKSFVQSGQVRYDLFPKRPLGVHRVESWVEDARGERISPYAEVVVNRLRRPRYWMKDAPSSPFGTHIHALQHDILMAKAVGLNWTRLHDAGVEYIGWHFLEPEKGRWQFRDAEIQRMRKYGMKVLGMLSTAPFWASYYPGKSHSSYFDVYYQPKDLDAYAEYVRTVTTRYRGVIDAYEVWNEPWNHGWWAVAYDESDKGSGQDPYRTSERPQADYARLMQTAYKAAKAVDPKLTIVGFNSTTGSGHRNGMAGADWTRGVLESGGLDACDVISYHHYLDTPLGYPGDAVEAGYRSSMGPILEKMGRLPKPVWLSEGSPVSGFPQGDGFYRHTLPYPNSDPIARTGDQVCRYVVSLLGQGVEKVFLYTMATRNSYGAPMQWSVLVNRDGSLHPSGVAHSNLAWHLEDTRFARRVPLAPNVHAYLFAGAGRAVAVVAPSEDGRYAAPASPSLTWTDLWGNPLAPGSAITGTVAYATLAGNVDALERALRGKGGR